LNRVEQKEKSSFDVLVAIVEIFVAKERFDVPEVLQKVRFV